MPTWLAWLCLIAAVDSGGLAKPSSPVGYAPTRRLQINASLERVGAPLRALGFHRLAFRFFRIEIHR